MTPAGPARGALLAPGFLLVGGAVFFNLGLCFLNTAGVVHASNGLIVGTEALLLIGALYAVRGRVQPAIPVVILLGLYLAGMKLINPYLDLKFVHDLAIMYLFCLLGLTSPARVVAVVVWAVIGGVLAGGLVELMFTDLYSHYFDVWRYYVDKGAVGADVVNYGSTNLFLSSTRGEGIGRTFLPGLLGAHRVSSVFLEPDSMGNFAALVFAWALSGRFETRTHRLLLVGVAVVCVVLADSRFGGGCLLMMLAVRQTQVWRSRLLMFLFPMLVLGALVCLGLLNALPGQEPSITGDDLAGRLLFSGRLLSYWSWPEWLALEPSRVYVADTGYAYVINSLGLLPAVAMLGVFAASRPASDEAMMMKAMVLVYFGTGLCIGASVFTIKTAGLLWFLYGAAAALPVRAAALRAGSWDGQMERDRPMEAVR